MAVLDAIPTGSKTEELEQLRRFVSAPLARCIARGEDPESGVCDLSVLFVDLRDYSRLADGRSPTEVFAFLSAYARLVSEIVEAQGGMIVEFSGDGLMVVFGAPSPHAAKENAAIAAGQALVEAMAELGLNVGVGIASGPTFIGHLPVADRLIWCAVGNTTILASRLQALSKTLTASIVVDQNTHAAAGDAVARFVCHAATPIRGRKHTETVFVLPRSDAAGTSRSAM